MLILCSEKLSSHVQLKLVYLVVNVITHLDVLRTHYSNGHTIQQQSWYAIFVSLQWRHNGRDGGSNHQPHDCLLIRLFRRRSKKTSKLCVTGLCAGNSPVTGEFPAQRPVTRKMFPFDDVIKWYCTVQMGVTWRPWSMPYLRFIYTQWFYQGKYVNKYVKCQLSIARRR